MSTVKQSRRRSKSAALGSDIKVSGVNKNALEGAKSNADQLLSGNSSIELKVSDNIIASFELMTIDSDKIDEETFVPEQNGRDPKFVTEQSVEDLIKTMTKRGQIVPGIGYITENGTIAVLSGSRRRHSCKSIGIPFRLYVTTEIINDSDAKYLADIANTSKPLSQIEQGRRYTHLINSKMFKNAKEIAEAEGITPSMVSMAISASKLPKSLISLFPHVTQLGRPTINALRTITKETSENLLNKAASKVAEIEFEQLCKLANSRNPYRLNATVLELLQAQLTTENSKAPTQSFSYLANGGGKYHIKISEGETSYKFEGLNEDKLKEVESAINEILGADT